MITLLIITIGILLIFIVNNLIIKTSKRISAKKGKTYKYSNVNKPIQIFTNTSLVLIVIAVIYLNFFTSDEKDSPKKETETYVEYDSLTNKLLTDLNLDKEANLTDYDINALKKAVELGLFTEKSFCEFFEEYKTIYYDSKFEEADEFLESLGIVENLPYLIKRKGSELCPNENSKIINSLVSKNVKSSSSNYQEVKINPCVMSEGFIKRDLRYPKTAKFSIFNCSSEKNSDGSYTVLRKVSAKNAFGVESEFIYKVRIGFTGGNEVDINNWKLIGIVSEEYNK